MVAGRKEVPRLRSGLRDMRNLSRFLPDAFTLSILAVVIFCAGATLQAVEMLGGHLVHGGAIIDAAFGEKLLAIILLVILAILFKPMVDEWLKREGKLL